MLSSLLNFQFYLFDFDGLLVDTERLHFLAYQRMCKEEGFFLDWSFEKYCQFAHYSSEAIKEALYREVLGLKQHQPKWEILYQKKRKAVISLFLEGAVQLMPGVEKFLKALHGALLPSCVVTHSPRALVDIVKKQYAVLENIPYWITREDYNQPKPHSECYQKAIDSFASPESKVIGFEDTPRGTWSLLGTRATPVLISQMKYPELDFFIKKGVLHFSSFEDLYS